MPVKLVRGDLFAAPDLPALAHGCNCGGAMGKGIAIEFRRRWPSMYTEYRRRCLDGQFGLGDVFVWDAPDRVVFNLGTQRHWRVGADPAAVQTALATMVRLAEQRGLACVGLPRIAAGLGGLDWPRVRSWIVEAAVVSTVTLVVFEVFEAGGDRD